MATLAEIQSMALGLPKADQLRLADNLLRYIENDESMTPDEILAEVMRRDQEMEDGIVQPLSVEEFWAGVRRVGDANLNRSL